MAYSTHHIQSVLKGLADLCLPVPIPMHTHNTGPNFPGVNPEINLRTKHIAVHFIIAREAPGDTLFVIFKVASVNNLAGICTKIVAKSAH